MTVQGWGRTALDYVPCRYGECRVAFRGPQRDLSNSYVAFLGGTETFGRFVVTPFPELVEGQLGLGCVNLGVANAGPDLYLQDPAILDIIRGARAVVVQATGVQNVSNRYYRVHPRRNDRFIAATEALGALYPEVDFTEFHFTRHLLQALHDVSPRRFQAVAENLCHTWTARMSRLIGMLDAPVIAFAFGSAVSADASGPLEGPPGLSDQVMVETLRPCATSLLKIVPSDQARAEGTLDMVFDKQERAVAEQLPGPLAHDEVADAVEIELRRILAKNADRRAVERSVDAIAPESCETAMPDAGMGPPRFGGGPGSDPSWQ